MQSSCQALAYLLVYTAEVLRCPLNNKFQAKKLGILIFDLTQPGFDPLLTVSVADDLIHFTTDQFQATAQLFLLLSGGNNEGELR